MTNMIDIIIIGAGPGGYELALEAANSGLSIVLIEKNEVGGTCLNHGCIPTKTYYHDAKLFKKSKELKVLQSNAILDFELTKERKKKVVADLVTGIKFSLDKAKVKLIYGTASLVDRYHVKVENEIYEAKYIVIATGSKSKIIPIKGIDAKNVITSDELLDISDIPSKLVVIGGGVIGIEMATIFKTFNSDVTIIESASTILPFFDKEIIKRFQAYLKTYGIKLILKTEIKEIFDNKIIYDNNGTINEIDFDKILLAVGRKPNIDNLELENCAIDIDKGAIKVNTNFQTNIDNIYAIGDVNNKMMLAHYATYSGYRVLNHILGRNDKINFDIVPSCVFTIPEIAMVGLTEDECILQNKEYRTIKTLYRSNGKAMTMNELDGFIKLIIENNYIIGAHILGEEANILIHEIMVLINNKISINDAKDYIHAHPTLSEIIATSLRD